MGDDAFGPMVVREVLRRGVPEHLRAVECGSDSLVLPSLWEGEPSVWLVDAVVRKTKPGTIHRLEHDEVLHFPQRHATVHHLSLPESIRWINLAYPEMRGIRYRLWGVEPGRLDLGEAVCGPVGAAVKTVAAEILEGV